MKILIAEDDFTSRLLLEGIFKKWGHEVISTQNGEEAWSILQKPDTPPVAILDWGMPGMSGVEVCRRAKSLERDIPIYVILLTVRNTKEDIVEGFGGGADDYITKSFDMRELRARIQAAERMLDIQNSLAQKVKELSEALEHIKTLQGILPICTYCHKIRNDDQAWEQLEAYIHAHSNAKFSHSICPECMKKYHPDIED